MTKSDSDGRVERPWGSFLVIHTGDDHRVKIITIEPGHELSLQLHERRSEHWVVLSGRATGRIGDEVFEMGPGDDARVPVGVKHRLANPGDTQLKILESQLGDYLAEDDIVRFEDHYGRI